MITQTITASMAQTSLPKILTRRYDVGREIKFILYKDELLSDPIDLTDYTVVITVIKPDNNFVIENFSGDTVTITDQMEVVTGTGYYCVHVTKGTETIYTGQGEFIIDDVLISDDELESISEVNGLKFPDDFITVEDHVAVIDDTVTTTEKTWSSSKISDEIENASVIVSKTAEGNPIELSDAAAAPLVECKTEIQGSQDLHGYDKPWVGGAGKNKAKQTVDGIKARNSGLTWAGNTTTVNNGTVTILTDNADNVIGYKFNGNFTQEFLFSVDDVSYVASENVIVSGCPSGSPAALEIWRSGSVIAQDTGSGVSVNAGSMALVIRVPNNASMSNLVYTPMIRLSTESAPTFAPYSNICPITAYTEGEIEVRGKNLIDISLLGSYDISGTGTMRIGVPVMLKPDTYTISRKSGSDTLYICNVTNNYSSTTITEYPFTFTLNQTSEIILRAATTDISRWKSVDLQLEVGTTATTYEPYKGVTHTTTYPSAIYRGSEDCVNGEVTSDRPVIDLGDLTWSAVSRNRWLSTGIKTSVSIPSSSSIEVGIVSEKYETMDAQSLYDNQIAYGIAVDNEGNLIVRNMDSINTPTGKIAYPLATPTTSSVTPTNLPIKSLLGYNRIESTTGNIEIEYITQDYHPLVDSIVMESERKITKLWDAGFTPAPGVWLEYDFGEDLENYDAIVILFVVSGWEGNYSDSVTIYPQIQHLNTNACYHYVKGTDYGTHVWHVSGTTYALGAISGNYPPQYKAVYGIKY